MQELSRKAGFYRKSGLPTVVLWIPQIPRILTLVKNRNGIRPIVSIRDSIDVYGMYAGIRDEVVKGYGSSALISVGDRIIGIERFSAYKMRL